MTGYRMGSATGRGTVERDSEVLLALAATGLLRMCGWAGVSDRSRPYPHSLQLALDRLGVACALARKPTPAPAHVGELVWDWCARRPVNTWPLRFHPEAQVGGELLLIDGEPTEFCHEWSVSASDVASEVHESALVAQVKTIADGLGRPDLYAQWRLFVTQNSVLSAAGVVAAKNRFLAVPQWAVWLDESYEEVPPEGTLGGSVGVCGGCEQWITPTTASQWRCTTWRCQMNAGGSNPRLVPAHGARRLRRELVRFVALPGLPELALAKALAARGARVVLYPGLDALDLVAHWPDGYSVGVDVKDWLKPYLLAKRIKPFPAWSDPHPYAYRRACLVIPADRVRKNRAYCTIVQNHSPLLGRGNRVEVLTDEALIASCPDTGSAGEVTCGP